MNAPAVLALLAQAASPSATELLESQSSGLGVGLFFLILLFVLLNGFFVAAEFSIIKVRGSQVEQKLEEGSRRARLTRRILAKLDNYVAAAQLGITLSSIALGVLVEVTVATILINGSDGAFAENPLLLHSIALVCTLALVTFLHIVLGETIPKTLATRLALPTALFVSQPLHLFYKLFKPAIWLFNFSSRGLLRLVKLDLASELEVFRSAEELRDLVAETERSMEVTAIEREILVNALDLNDRCARDVMLPRADVIWLDLNKDFETNFHKAVDSQHTRFPLVDGHLDHPQGLVHIKDLIKLSREESPKLSSIKRKLEHIPELMPLDSLLKVFLSSKAHMALVVDEYGGSLGIVTLDNVIEELVGDINDEFDDEEEHVDFFERINDHTFEVEGTMALYELSEYTDLQLEDPEVSTIGGYATQLLGRLPDVGEEVQIEDYMATILESDGKSVGKLRFERTEEAIAAINEREEEDMEDEAETAKASEESGPDSAERV